jgi:hypothetical protein
MKMIYTTIVLCIGLGVGPAWSQSELDHPAERTVTLPDGSVRPIRLGGGPAIGQTEIGQLERRVTLPDGSLGTIRVPIWSSQAEGYPSQGIQSALERYREAGDDTPDRAAIRAEVEQYLNEEYDRHLAVHVEQLEELESRLNKLRQQLERRQAAKAKLVELKLELMLSQADGLGWPEATNPPGWQGFGPQASSFRGSASPFEMPGGPNTQPNNNPFDPLLMPNTRRADPAFPGAAYPSQPPAERRPNDAYAPPMPAASVPFESWNPNNTLPGVPSAYQGLQGMPPSRNQQSFPTPPETGLGRRPASGAGRPLPVSPGTDTSMPNIPPTLPNGDSAIPSVAPGQDPVTTAMWQTLVAIHNYHDAYNRLPFSQEPVRQQGSQSANDPSNLSWRVQVLPYIDPEYSELFQQFDLRQDWDSEQNKPLLEKMPVLFGEGTHTQLRWVKSKAQRLVDVTDGTSNTIALIHGGSPVPWTAAEPLTPSEAVEWFRALGPQETLVVGMYDGSVKRLVRGQTSVESFEAMLTPSNQDR